MIKANRIGIGFGLDVGFGPSVGVGDLYINELDKLASLEVVLAYILPLVRGMKDLAWAWLYRIIVARWGWLVQASARINYSKVERYNVSIPERFLNGLIELLGKSF